MELDFLSEEQQELFAKGERTYPLFRNRAEDIEAACRELCALLEQMVN